MRRLLNSILLLVPVATLAAAWFLLTIWAWAIAMLLLLAFVVAVGARIVQLGRGALIDERNKISLSRFQTLAWTIMIVAGFFVAAMHNVRTRQDDPLAIAIPVQLWAVLGISVTSLAGSSLVKQEKTKLTAEPESAKLAMTKAHVASGGTNAMPSTMTAHPGNLLVVSDPTEPMTEQRVVAKGVLTVNDDPQCSSWLDMFRTEEIGGVGRLDLGKIQMFYFTLAVLFVYGSAMASLFLHQEAKIGEFPELSTSAIALLGISHAAYLTTKAAGGSTPTQ